MPLRPAMGIPMGACEGMPILEAIYRQKEEE